MAMSRKDFVFIAQQFASLAAPTNSAEAENMRRLLASDMADVCRAACDRFDRSKFLDACDVPHAARGIQRLPNGDNARDRAHA